MTDNRFIIRKIEQPTPDTVVLELVRPIRFDNPSNGAIFDFKPGQYVMLSYRDEYGRMTDRHAFSIASSPTQKDHLKLGIRIGGKFTRGLINLNPGDDIFVAGPFGKFVFNSRKHRDLVLIAGGIGITPFLSTIQYATDHGLSNKLTLLYSNKTLEGTLFYNEIKDLEQKNENLRALFCVTEKTSYETPGIINKRINPAVIDDFVGSVNGKTFFICGPSPFMSGMRRNLELLGAQKHQIEMEEFSMLQSFDLVSAAKNSAYALSISGALILVPLYFFINNAGASYDPGFGSIFSKASPYNIANIYRIGKREYDSKAEKISIPDPLPVASEATSTAPVATETPAPKTKNGDSPISKTVAKPAVKPAAKPAAPKKTTAATQTQKTKTAPAPKPRTEVSVVTHAEETSQQTSAPSPVTAASTARSSQNSNSSAQQTTQTTPSPVTSASNAHAGTGQQTTSNQTTPSAPAPATSASTVAGSQPTGSGTTAPTPAPATSASSPASGSTGSQTTAQTEAAREAAKQAAERAREAAKNEHEDDDDD